MTPYIIQSIDSYAQNYAEQKLKEKGYDYHITEIGTIETNAPTQLLADLYNTEIQLALVQGN